MLTIEMRRVKEEFVKIKFKLVDLFIWGFMSLSTLYRSYHDG